MDAIALRRWLAARRAAEAREREDLRGVPLAPVESMHQALELIALASRLHGWPLPDDPSSVRDDEVGYERWRRLRASWLRERGGRN